MINLEIKENLIRLAMHEAQPAADEGNYPFGAVVADCNGNVIAAAHNTQETDRDPTAHAEINLIRKLAKEYQQEEFGHFIWLAMLNHVPCVFLLRSKQALFIIFSALQAKSIWNPLFPLQILAKLCRVSLDISYGVLGAGMRSSDC